MSFYQQDGAEGTGWLEQQTSPSRISRSWESEIGGHLGQVLVRTLFLLCRRVPSAVCSQSEERERALGHESHPFI